MTEKKAAQTKKPAAKKTPKPIKPLANQSVEIESPAQDAIAFIKVGGLTVEDQAVVDVGILCNGVFCAQGSAGEKIVAVKGRRYKANADVPPAPPPGNATIDGHIYGQQRLWRFFCSEGKKFPGDGKVNPTVNNNRLAIWVQFEGEAAFAAPATVDFKGKKSTACDCD